MALLYKGLRGTLTRRIVSDAEVDGQIEKLKAQHPRLTPVLDRPSRTGDELVLDYAGFCEGRQFEGGTAQGQTLTLGSGAFIPGFEEQLVGRNVGDRVDVHVAFPTPYHAPELAGKPAVFKCVVHEIRRKEPWTDGDAFAREALGMKDHSDLRARVRADMQRWADRQAEEELRLQLLDAAIADFDPPFDGDALEAAVQQQLDALEAQLSRQGLDLDAYCRFTGKTVEQLRADCLPDAKMGLRRQQALKLIAEAEGLEADEASVAEAIMELCRQNGVTPEQLAPHIDARARAAIERNVLNARAMDRIRESARVETIVMKGNDRA